MENFIYLFSENYKWDINQYIALQIIMLKALTNIENNIVKDNNSNSVKSGQQQYFNIMKKTLILSYSIKSILLQLHLYLGSLTNIELLYSIFKLARLITKDKIYAVMEEELSDLIPNLPPFNYNSLKSKYSQVQGWELGNNKHILPH